MLDIKKQFARVLGNKCAVALETALAKTDCTIGSQLGFFSSVSIIIGSTIFNGGSLTLFKA